MSNSKKPAVFFFSLGCPKNLVDSEVMKGLLKKTGYHLTTKPESAQIAIINTCGFISDAQEESIKHILELVSLKTSGKLERILVTGCLVQRFSRELIKELPEIDGFIGTGDFHRIVEALDKVQSGETICWAGKPEFLYDHQWPRLLTPPKHYAYLKVAEGCDNRCSYCVIPQIRGNFRSRSLESIIMEASRLVNDGVREIILVAQDTTKYGQDLYGSYKLPELLREICRIPDLRWVRWLYGYPQRITDELIEVMGNEEKICSYIDMPIQHIDDRILCKMNRQPVQGLFADLIPRLRAKIPRLALRTSVILGFPGETEEIFARLLQSIQDNPFDRLGAFVYSPEEGTPAAKMDGAVPEEIKEQRYHQIMQTQQIVSHQLNQKWIGQSFEVVCESREGDWLVGRSQREAPEIDGMIYYTGNQKAIFKPGEVHHVKIKEADYYDLVGEALS